jgi:hypothetical protein
MCVDDLHDHRQVERKTQNVSIVQVMGPAKTHWAAKHSGARQMQFSGAKHNGIVQRSMFVFIGLSDENPKQETVLRQSPSMGGRPLGGRYLNNWGHT